MAAARYGRAYWRRAAELVPLLAPEEQDTLLASAIKFNVGRALLKEIRTGINIGRSKGLGAGKEPLTLDRLDEFARDFARQESRYRGLDTHFPGPLASRKVD